MSEISARDGYHGALGAVHEGRAETEALQRVKLCLKSLAYIYILFISPLAAV